MTAMPNGKKRVGSIAALLKSKSDAAGTPSAESVAARALQLRFLPVFWLLRMADWLQGPYFYEVYASKVINGVQVSTQGVAQLFLTGFGTTALFGAVVGGLVDGVARELIAACLAVEPTARIGVRRGTPALSR